MYAVYQILTQPEYFCRAQKAGPTKDKQTMARKTKIDTEKTYLALLDAAAELFLQKGVNRTTLQEIAAHAGLTRGAVYWHFKGKDEIVLQIWEVFAQEHMNRFIATLNALPDTDAEAVFRKTLHQLISHITEDYRAGQALSIVMHIVEFTTEETPLQQQLVQSHTNFIDAMQSACNTLQAQGALRPGIRPDIAAKGLLSYMSGLIKQYLWPHRFADLKQDGAALLNLYLDAVLNGKTATHPPALHPG